MQTDERVCCQQTELLKSPDIFNILVGVTGSVAALKLPLLVSQLLQLSGVSSFPKYYKNQYSLFLQTILETAGWLINVSFFFCHSNNQIIMGIVINIIIIILV